MDFVLSCTHSLVAIFICKQPFLGQGKENRPLLKGKGYKKYHPQRENTTWRPHVLWVNEQIKSSQKKGIRAANVFKIRFCRILLYNIPLPSSLHGLLLKLIFLVFQQVDEISFRAALLSFLVSAYVVFIRLVILKATKVMNKLTYYLSFH